MSLTLCDSIIIVHSTLSLAAQQMSFSGLKRIKTAERLANWTILYTHTL